MSQKGDIMNVTGDEYPPPPEKAMLSRMVSYLQIGIIMTIAVGDTVLPMIGLPVPEALKTLQENKFMYCIGCQFVIGGFASSLTSTGAFEIYVDDVLVYSKLETGQQITAYQLQAIFEPYGVVFVQP